MKAPDLTPAQIVSALAALATALVVLFKLNISGEQQAAFATAIGVIVPIGWQIADAIIRHGRAGVAAAQHVQAAAEVTAAAATAHLDHVEVPVGAAPAK